MGALRNARSQHLHGQNERLIDAALAVLAAAAERTADRHESAGETGEAAGDAAEKTGEPVEPSPIPRCDDRPADQHQRPVRDQKPAEQATVEVAVELQQQPDSERQSDDPAREEIENAEQVHHGLLRLSLPHREVLTLLFLEDFSVEAIAQGLDVPPGTVK